MNAIVTQYAISETERENRQKAIDFARNSVRLEGVIFSDEDELINQRFIDGEMNAEQMVKEFETRYQNVLS